jgi:sorting and assembly machinery component 37
VDRFSSFVESHGQPLIDLSLYVSSHNFISTTRPLYNTIQSFPLPYLTPPAIRAAAKVRTAHLGLSSLDIDQNGPETYEQSIIPQSLRKPKTTISSVLAGSPETSAQIKLDALATDFFEPLQKLKGRKQYLVSDSNFSSLDCLALGYLSLMLVPELPQPWLAQTMRRRFPDICSWVEDLSSQIFGGPVDADDAFLTTRDEFTPLKGGKSSLPWVAPSNGGMVGVGSVFLSSIADSIPLVGQLRRNTRMRQHGGKTHKSELESSSWQSISTIGSLVAGLGMGIGYLFYQGLISLPAGESNRYENTGSGYNDFGDAGEILGIYSNKVDVETQKQEAGENRGMPVTEVDIEFKPGGVTVTDRVS